ncbi:MAG: hypothetical protein ACI9BD_000502 [Candidatus Marinamargulisbacteria bacterium]|jgi:hypothetical protein
MFILRSKLLMVACLLSGVFAAPILLSAQTESVSVNEVPPIQMDIVTSADIRLLYGESVGVRFPESDLVTVKSTIRVKALNRYLTPVFVNGELIPFRRNGVLEGKYELRQFGQQTVLITFVLPGDRLLTLKRNVTHLYVPPDIDEFSAQRKLFVYFYNTKFLHDPDRNRKLNSRFTRADLAYFVAQLNDVQVVFKKDYPYQDLSSEFWAAPQLDYALSAGFISEFPDGAIRPNEPVKRIEYLISLIRSQGWELVRTEDPIPYKDVDPSHWTAKYVRTALKYGLIVPGRNLSPDRILSVADFIEMAQNAQPVKLAFSALFEKKEADTADLEAWALRKIRHVLWEREKENSGKEMVAVDRPYDNFYTYKSVIPFEGEIFPPGEFFINGKSYFSNDKGRFRLALPVVSGKNVYRFQIENKENNISVYGFSPFKDLENHWIEDTAVKLRYLNLLGDESFFRPKEKMTRSTFARLIVQIFGFNSDRMATESGLQDLGRQSKNYEEIETVVDLGILKTDEEGYFFPERLVSKAEALTAVIRACKFKIMPEADETSFLPYQDVSRDHWAFPYLVTGLQNSIISPGTHFYPSRVITKAELVALISKTPVIKEKIKLFFSR